MKRIWWVLFIFPEILFSQSLTTITATINTPTGVPAAIGYVEFRIQPSSPSILYTIPGVNVVVPTTSRCTILNGTLVGPNGSGVCQVWPNTSISPSNTTYTVVLAPNNTVGSTVARILITGSTYNLSSPTFAPVVNIVPQFNTITTSPISANIVPAANKIFTLGNSGNYFGQAYIDTLFMNSCSGAGCTGGGSFGSTITGLNPALTLSNTGETLPLGLWRVRMLGDVIQLEKNTAVGGDFSTFNQMWSDSTTGFGITCNPQAALHVCGTTFPQINLQSTGAGGHNWALQSDQASGNLELIDKTAGLARATFDGTSGLFTYLANSWLQGNIYLANDQSSFIGSAGTGAGTMGFDITGVQTAPAKTRTAVDLRPPTQCWGNSACVTEIVIVGTGDGAVLTPSAGMDVGWNGYDTGFELYVECSGGLSCYGISFAVSDHNMGNLGHPELGLGTNRDAMEIINTATLGFDQNITQGSVMFGRYAAKAPRETITDTAAVNMIILKPPAFNTVTAHVDSHAIVYIANSYDGALTHQSDWKRFANATDNVGHSKYTLSHRIDAAAFVGVETIDDTGNLLATTSVTAGTSGTTGSVVVNGSTSGTLTFTTAAVAGSNTITGATAGIGIGTSTPISTVHITGASWNAGGITSGLVLDQAGGLAAGGLQFGRLNSNGIPAIQDFANSPLSINPNGGAVIIGAGTATGYTFFVNAGTSGLQGRVYTPNISAETGTKAAMCLDTVTGEVEVNTGVSTCIISSLRFKDWLGDLSCGESLRIVKEMQPGTFRYKGDPTEHFGFAAEQVAVVEPRLVVFEKDGSPRSVEYELYTAVLTKAVQCWMGEK
jgi:hypothetical protein